MKGIIKGIVRQPSFLATMCILVVVCIVGSGCTLPPMAAKPLQSEAPPSSSKLHPQGEIQAASHVEPAPQEEGDSAATNGDSMDIEQANMFDLPNEPQRQPFTTRLPPVEAPGVEQLPIDLPSALRLAGANNLQIALAAERVEEAFARFDRAHVLWVPSLSGGVVYNKHDGRLQETQGEILEVSRNSLFVGGGPGVANAPLTGGSSGPARLFVDLSLADAIFEPLAARQRIDFADAHQAAVFNDALLAAAVAYLQLAQAQAQAAIAAEAEQNAQRLADITRDFERVGEGLEADAQRAEAELAFRRSQRFAAEEQIGVASAELVRLLRLDPCVRLSAVEGHPVPVTLVDECCTLCCLIEMAHSSRPELARQSAYVDERYYRVRQEHWRPWLPHLYAGFSAGGFGGGQGSDLLNFADRTDLDLAAVWKLENLGFGVAARRREQDSRYSQAQITLAQMRDLVAAEVARAYYQIHARRGQMAASSPQVEAAMQALRLNLEGITGGELRPIEAQQAIGGLASARQQYLEAVIAFNRAQLELLRAVGRTPSSP